MGTIDPKRGIYGNKTLEIRIDINARMPAPLRQWACDKMRERERAALNGQNTMAPFSCQKGFDPSKTADILQVIIDSHVQNTATLVKAKNASTQQSVAGQDCVADQMPLRVTKKIRTDIAAGNLDKGALQALQGTAQTVQQECLVKAGL